MTASVLDTPSLGARPTVPAPALPQPACTSADTARCFVLFSGHNDRAVIALARYFTQAGLPFVVVSAGPGDAIHRTAYAPRVVFERRDRLLDAGLFLRLAESLGPTLVLVPTTEYINDFLLGEPAVLAHPRLVPGLPSATIYRRLTSKLDSQALLAGVPGLHLPGRRPLAEATAPCVLKPARNTLPGEVLYPLLCDSATELADAVARLDPALWFAQDYVRGQSHYYCACLARDGHHVGFWQENLMQQAAGKSIVLAREGENPGVDTVALMQRLHAAGFHGPLMVEVIVDAAGRAHYIETNPRFWGPLQLALDACPALLDLYATEQGLPPASATPRRETAGKKRYAWAYGASRPGTRRLPAAEALAAAELERSLQCHDVYARADTIALHGRH
jgi:hypothetical protein